MKGFLLSVTVYSDDDYHGRSATLGAGRHKLDPAANASISSLRIPGGWQVTLHEKVDFSGAQALLTSDTPRLPDNLNGNAASITIKQIRPGTRSTQGATFTMEDGDAWFYFEDETMTQ